MTLTDAAAVPAVYADRLRLAEQSGEVICELVRKGISSRDVLTKKALENAVRVCLAIGGSTNAVLHLTALAYEAELDIDILKAFEEFSPKTPTLAKVYPAGNNDMEAFWKAGGMPRIIENMQSLLHMDVMTGTGRTMQENIDNFQYRFPADSDVIRGVDEPFAETGGLSVMRGNLAPRDRNK